jgi:hypothetical protein
MSKITRQVIVETARSYKGVPYQDQGRTREEGLDCVGELIVVAHDIGYTDFESLPMELILMAKQWSDY